MKVLVRIVEQGGWGICLTLAGEGRRLGSVSTGVCDMVRAGGPAGEMRYLLVTENAWPSYFETTKVIGGGW